MLLEANTVIAVRAITFLSELIIPPALSAEDTMQRMTAARSRSCRVPHNPATRRGQI
jgi:hypothetical protein